MPNGYLDTYAQGASNFIGGDVVAQLLQNIRREQADDARKQVRVETNPVNVITPKGPLVITPKGPPVITPRVTMGRAYGEPAPTAGVQIEPVTPLPARAAGYLKKK